MGPSCASSEGLHTGNTFSPKSRTAFGPASDAAPWRMAAARPARSRSRTRGSAGMGPAHIRGRRAETRGLFAKCPMIPALKAAVAHWSGIPEGATVRPPLVTLTREQSAALVTELEHTGFAMPGLRG